MPELPDRPDIDQLRHQARALHRAAAAGEPDALARLRRFSDLIVLSTAQLAVAREYGYPSWPALRAEVERRRYMLSAATRPAHRQSAPGWPDQRYSFGGSMAIQTATGVLTPELLTVEDEEAVLHASAVLEWQAPSGSLLRRWRGPQRWPTFDDLTVTDDQGLGSLTVRFGGGSIHPRRPGLAPRRSDISFWIEPAPSARVSWIELRTDNEATRLVPSPRAAVRVGEVAAVSANAAAERRLEELGYFLLNLRHSAPDGDLSRQRANALARSAEIQESGDLTDGSALPAQLARLCACLTDEHLAKDLPPEWQRFLDAASQADGEQRSLDLGAALPQLGDAELCLDHFVSGPASWKLYLRAKPTWWGRSEDGRRKWELVSVRADDDLGGRYVSNFGGSTGHGDHEDLQLVFVPRLDPLARSLNLRFSAGTAEVVADLELVCAGTAGDQAGS